MDALIRLDGVTKRCGGAGRSALDGIGLRVAAEEATAERHALEALPPSTDNTAGLLAQCNAGSRDAFTAKMHATASPNGNWLFHDNSPDWSQQ
jgi:hypothetical protein